MRQVLVLRPEPGNSATCIAASALGLTPLPAPLFVYSPRAWRLPPNTAWDGLLIGSAAVFAHAGVDLAVLRLIPVHAVGSATAQAAVAAGFTVARIGSGGLQPLVDALPPGRYLRLAGEAHVTLAPPPGVTVDDCVVYRAQPQPLSPHAVTQIRREPVLALLHSAEAARHFASQCGVHRLPRKRIMLACLGPRIAAAAGDGWQATASAARPENDAVLSLALQMCQQV